MLLRDEESLGSTQQEEAFLSERVLSQGSAALSPLQSLSEAAHLDAYYKRVDAAVWDSDQWDMIAAPQRVRRCSSFSLAMLLKAAGAAYHLKRCKLRGFPYRLSEILLASSQECAAILATKRCMLDCFSKSFLNVFSSPEKLMSEGREVLQMLFRFVRPGIERLECRNALIRRLATDHASSSGPREWTEASAKFLTATQRNAKRQGWFDFNLAQKKEPFSACGQKRNRHGKYKERRNGGGGVRRAILSELLKGQVYRSKQERSDALRRAHASAREVEAKVGAELMRSQRIGKAGAVSHQQGSMSFGGVRKQGRGAKRLPVFEQKQRRVMRLMGDACTPVLQSHDSLQCTLSDPVDDATEDTDIVAVSAFVMKDYIAQVADEIVAVREKEEDADTCSMAIKQLLASHSHDSLGGLSSSFPWLSLHRGLYPLKIGRSMMADLFPPVLQVCRRALSSQGELRPDARCAQHLMRQWNALHVSVQACDLPSLPDSKDIASAVAVSLCYHAGFCLCKGPGAATRRLAQDMQRCLRSLLEKGSKAKDLYQAGLLVLRLSTCEDDLLHLWFHLSYVNLSNMRCVLTQMMPSSDTALVEEALSYPSSVALQVGCACVEDAIVNLWEALHPLDKSVHWQVLPCSLSTSRRQVHGIFCPGLAIVEVPRDVDPLQVSLVAKPRVPKGKAARECALDGEDLMECLEDGESGASSGDDAEVQDLHVEHGSWELDPEDRVAPGWQREIDAEVMSQNSDDERSHGAEGRTRSL